MKENSKSDFVSSSFTDLMASLAVIFILLTVVFIRQASLQSKRGKETVRNGLSEVLSKNNLPLKQDAGDPLALSVSVGENVLKFAINSAALSPKGTEFLDGFIPSFIRQLCTEPIRSSVDAILIEGHTDRSGELDKEGFRRNIRLSQSRSFSVLERALHGVQNEPELTACLLSKVSATGRGSGVPVLVAGKYEADLSRRVEIKIRVKSAEQGFVKTLGSAAAQGGAAQ